MLKYGCSGVLDEINLRGHNMDEIKRTFTKVFAIIESAKKNAYRKVNEELINMYWRVGQFISEEAKTASYGDSFIDELSKYIQDTFPGIKGFNRRGLYRMKQFYEAYANYEKVSPLVTQINWTNNLLILSGTKSIEEKEFYLRLCIQENYSKRELERQLDSAYYERYMLSKGKALPEGVKKINNNPFFDEEYKVQVGGEDYAIDLLFFHRGLQCLVAFELKIGKFKPEYVSKMDFYLEALDRQVKKEHENPSVGLILCATKNDEVVEYIYRNDFKLLFVFQ